MAWGGMIGKSGAGINTGRTAGVSGSSAGLQYPSGSTPRKPQAAGTQVEPHPPGSFTPEPGTERSLPDGRRVVSVGSDPRKPAGTSDWMLIGGGGGGGGTPTPGPGGVGGPGKVIVPEPAAEPNNPMGPVAGLQAAGPGGGAAQIISGQNASRPGLGQRTPPSLEMLLRGKLY